MPHRALAPSFPPYACSSAATGSPAQSCSIPTHVVAAERCLFLVVCFASSPHVLTIFFASTICFPTNARTLYPRHQACSRGWPRSEPCCRLFFFDIPTGTISRRILSTIAHTPQKSRPFIAGGHETAVRSGRPRISVILSLSLPTLTVFRSKMSCMCYSFIIHKNDFSPYIHT